MTYFKCKQYQLKEDSMALRKKVAAMIVLTQVKVISCPKCKVIFANEEEQKQHKCDMDKEVTDDEN